LRSKDIQINKRYRDRNDEEEERKKTNRRTRASFADRSGSPAG
jgi:hypothetical protein